MTRVRHLLSLPLLAASPMTLALSDAATRHGGAALATAGYLAFCGLIWQRHRRRLQREQAAIDALLTGDAPPLLIAHASQTGTAERLAWQSAEALQQAGIPVRLLPLAALDADTLRSYPRALFIVSTYGEGDPPDAAVPFARRLLGQTVDPHGQPLDLHGLQFGLLALGDSSYADFCGFGRRLGHWLRAQGAVPLFDAVEVDNGDGGALRHWQHHLGQLGGRTDLADWSSPGYGRWRLVERRCLNPGSAGAPAFLIALEPLDGDVSWEAGDIAEIGPRRDSAAVETLLTQCGLDGDEPVEYSGERLPLRAALLRSLPPSEPVDATSPRALAERLQSLPHREYSIASLSDSGRVELLVRQQHHPNGSLGLGSGYLTAIAAVGDEIAVRLRANGNFHPPQGDCPLILIGNGTGIAGLRAHLQAREARGQRNNWLLFGERSAAHDYFFRDEIERWQGSGHLARVDLAFSRDGGRVYVQQRLREAGAVLRQWVDDGAAIYVCGSLQGMAPAVHAVLNDMLGEACVERLTESGRYRRDVY